MGRGNEDRLLRGVAEAAELLVRGGAEAPVLAQVMRALGDAAEADRAYLFENAPLPDGRAGMSQRVEWVREGISPELDNPDLQGLAYEDAMETAWREELEAGRSVGLKVAEMPAVQQELFRSQAIRSLLLTPILASGRFWGFVGFDDCRAERRWSEAERAILTAAAALIGAHVAWKESEAERRRQEGRFQSLVEGAADGLWELDAGGRYTYVSPVFSEIIGAAPEEAIGSPPGRFLAAGDGERLERLLAESERSSLPIPLTRVTSRQRPAQDVILELAARPYTDERGRHLGWRGTARDVTARFRDEQLRAALFAISEALGNAQDLDDLFLSVHGVLAGLMPARNMYIALWDEESELLSFPYHVDEVDPPPPPRRRGRGLTEYVLRTGRTLLATPGEYEALYASGEVELIGSWSVDWLGVPLKTAGRTIGVVAVQSYEDGIRYREADARTLEFVSAPMALAIERRRAEDERRRLLVSLEEAQAVAHVGSWELQSSLSPLLLVSAETLRIFRLSPGPARRSPEEFLARMRPADAEACRRLAREALAGGHGFELEARLVVDGREEETVVHATAQVVRREAGAIERVVGVVRDVTERKRSEERLLSVTEEMRRSIAALQERNQEITVLAEMGRLLQACRTTEEIHAIAGRLGPRLFEGGSGALLVTDVRSSGLRVAASWGLPPAPRDFSRDDCWALRLLRPHAWSAPGAELRCAHLAEAEAVSALCVPLTAQGQPLGVLSLVHGEAPEKGRAEALASLAGSAAEQVSLALANLELREILRDQAIRDALTGLFNRRYLEDALERELRRADRKGRPLGVLMMDLDHFKRFNDAYGHESGDALLRAFGSFLRGRIRAEDVACRYGGEEFVLLLPDCGRSDARRRAEELRRRARQIRVSVPGFESAGVALSVGGAVYPDDGASSRDVLRAADEALYRAKEQGRDQVVIAGTS